MKTKVAIIGGGINGLMSAWKLSLQGYKVDLYESDIALSKTSSSSSKLLHGGIRYLEFGHINLVRQSLYDRHWWLKNAREFCNPIEMVMPIYKNSPRKKNILFLGAYLYQILAGRFSLGKTKYLNYENTKNLCPELNSKNLTGAVSFFDAQMDEKKLGNWVLEQAINSGVNVFENSKIDSFTQDGILHFQGKNLEYSVIINAGGPWAYELNKSNSIPTNFCLELVRGSHIVINNKVSNPYLIQELNNKRIVFILPYLGNTLIGTTEVIQNSTDNISCSEDEIDYLIKLYNENIKDKIDSSNIVDKFSGLRPIVKRIYKNNLSNITSANRDAKIEVCNKMLTIYGGKWTSAPSLADLVVKKVDSITR